MSRRIPRPTPEQINNSLLAIKKDLKFHIGKQAIVFVRRERDMLPYLVEICEVSDGVFSGRYKCWDSENRFRCYLSISLNPIDIFTAYQRIIYFDEGI